MRPRFDVEFMMFLGCQINNTDITIGCGIILDFGVLAAILLRYPVLAQIESVVGPSGHDGSWAVTGGEGKPSKDSGAQNAEASVSVAPSRSVRGRRRGSAVR
jgi:hypothetical protein